ncbi:MAG TPA: response regulator transcription factor [Acidimicrobiales bacterium]|nr:response regulator transcription factor [Acidimicrobiales bacterium]
MADRQMSGEAAPPSGAGGRLLVVDDDHDVRGMLARLLDAEGYHVVEATNGAEALAALDQNRVDLVVLDVMLGDEDGRDVLANIRKKAEIPVIMLTGRGQESERVLGLKLGADDYVVKPFSPAELAARIATVLRRTRPRTPGASMEFDGLTIDVASREVRIGGDEVEMTAKEFDLMAFLAASPRQVFSREQLLEHVWESSSAWQDASTVTEHVRRIRRKIESDPDNPRWVKTVRGVGYRFEP